jgi:glutathione S-transferase
VTGVFAGFVPGLVENMANVVLHQWEISPYFRKVSKALRLKRIPFQSVDSNGMRAPQAARLSKSGKLPVLDWDEQRLADSTLICEILDRRRVVGPLFRRGLKGRLKAHGFGGWSNEQIERWFFGHLDDVAAWLEGRQWLVGDAQSIADLAVSAQLEESSAPARWLSACLSVPR